MTPPMASVTSETAGSDMQPAGHLRFETLKKRADFLRAAKARRVVTPGFILQINKRSSKGPIRVGYTCSKKVGNSVARNRAKRRLREISRLVLPYIGNPGTDYVLIGRSGVTATRQLAAMQNELRAAVQRSP